MKRHPMDVEADEGAVGHGSSEATCTDTWREFSKTSTNLVLPLSVWTFAHLLDGNCRFRPRAVLAGSNFFVFACAADTPRKSESSSCWISCAVVSTERWRRSGRATTCGSMCLGRNFLAKLETGARNEAMLTARREVIW